MNASDHKINRRYFTKLPGIVLRRLGDALGRFLVALGQAVPGRKRNAADVQDKYDGLAGSYIAYRRKALAEPHEMIASVHGSPQRMRSDAYLEAFERQVAEEVFLLDPQARSFLEVGVGEYTTAAGALARAGIRPQRFVGLDLSWSRLFVGEQHARAEGCAIEQSVMGDVFHLPFLDNAFDVVYTVHCLEQSPFNTTQALRELHRVARSYLVLIEPSYELSNATQRRRMVLQDYVRDIPQAVAHLGLRLERHALCAYGHYLNCPAIYRIAKRPTGAAPAGGKFLACPRDAGELVAAHGHLVNPRLGLAYPVLRGIACLHPEQAIRASRFLS